MSVATHLGIDIAEYDARIRTFIPAYESMLDVAARVIPRRARTIVDLGTGTGALGARCLAHSSRARIVGIDADRDILTIAARRLPSRAEFIRGSFLRAALPPCDAVVSSFALHHVRTRAAKARLYRRLRSALGTRGVLVSVDCHPSTNRDAAREQREAWAAHLRRSYSRSETEALLKAWSHEDLYVPLESEVALMTRAGFAVDVVLRRGSFAVIRAQK